MARNILILISSFIIVAQKNEDEIMIKQKIFLILFVILIVMTMNILANGSCKCCFVLTSPTCETRSIKFPSECTASWCQNNVAFCHDSIPPCFARHIQ